MHSTAPCLTWYVLVYNFKGKRKVIEACALHGAQQHIENKMNDAVRRNLHPGTIEIVTLMQSNKPRVGSIV